MGQYCDTVSKLIDINLSQHGVRYKMTGKNPLGNSQEPQAYEGNNIIVPVGGWRLVKSVRAPTTNDKKYPIGSIWINTTSSTSYQLCANPGVWTVLGTGSGGDIQTLTADSGGALLPTTGNMNILGTANQITTAGAGSTITASLPVAITAPGSLTTTTTLAAGTTVTAGTGITATTGNIQASGGDIITTRSAAGSDVTVEATNSDNTNGASRAGVEIATGGASSGDPYLSFQISGVAASTMTMGLDNSASDLFVVSNSGSIGTSNALTLTQAGALNATTSITAGTTLTATLGAITATNGNLSLATAGNKIIIATGANASVGTSAAMAGTPGAVTVATTASSATAKIFYSRATTGGTPGDVSITAQDGTGFTLTSTGNETSTFNWWIINA